MATITDKRTTDYLQYLRYPEISKKKAKDNLLFVKFYTQPKVGLIFTEALLPSAISKCQLSPPGSSVPAFEVVLQRSTCDYKRQFYKIQKQDSW